MSDEKTPASSDSTSQQIIKNPTEALESALVAEAIKRHEASIREGVLESVTLPNFTYLLRKRTRCRLMRLRDECIEKVEFFTKGAAWYAKKLAALQAGDFTFNDRTGEIVPNDAELRRANY